MAEKSVWLDLAAADKQRLHQLKYNQNSFFLLFLTVVIIYLVISELWNIKQFVF